VQRELFEFERGVEVDVIEMDERQRAGIGARPLQVRAHVRAPQVLCEQARR
jgi:hypothetical protein